MRSQAMWLANIKSQGCGSCHQLGNKPTRIIEAKLGKFDNSLSAWTYRMQVGPAAEIMVRNIGQLDSQHALKNFADWSDRIAAGELPKSQPARPTGLERNVVVTLWDWGTPTDYLHDEVATDRRNPTVNANGKIYGATEDFDRSRAGARSGHAHHVASEAHHPHAGEAARHVHLVA